MKPVLRQAVDLANRLDTFGDRLLVFRSVANKYFLGILSHIHGENKDTDRRGNEYPDDEGVDVEELLVFVFFAH